MRERERERERERNRDKERHIDRREKNEASVHARPSAKGSYYYLIAFYIGSGVNKM